MMQGHDEQRLAPLRVTDDAWPDKIAKRERGQQSMPGVWRRLRFDVLPTNHHHRDTCEFQILQKCLRPSRPLPAAVP